MAIIHIVSLNPELKSAIANKQYTEEEIIQLNKKIKESEKSKKKVFIVTMSLLTAVLLIGGIIIYGSNIGFPDALPLLLLNLLVVPVVGPISWYAAVGRMSKQWDDLMSYYYPNVYMDSKYGKVGQSAEETAEPEPVRKPKVPVSGKSVLKKVYYIMTGILSVLVILLLVIATIPSAASRHGSDDLAGNLTTVLLAFIAAGFLFLSVKGMFQDCYIPGIMLEKVGVLFVGLGLIVFITGLLSQGKMLEALLICVPAFIIGVVCFIIGMKLINKKREQH